MAHASGISPSAELTRILQNCRDDNCNRIVKVQIESESLVMRQAIQRVGDARSDFGQIAGIIDDVSPCYIIFRLDGMKPPAEWLLMMYVPENAKVREKMLYASSRDALKKEIGYSNVVCEMHATEKEEATWNAYERSVLCSEADRLSVMSASERARLSLKDGTKDFVLLRVDLKAESIELASENQGGFNEFKGLLEREHSSEPRYSFLAVSAPDAPRMFSFIFSCPESASVRVKMMYSTAKSAVLETAEGLGVNVVKRLEVRDLADLTQEEAQPEQGSTGTTEEQSQAEAGALGGAIARPKGPGGRRGLVRVPVFPM